MPAGELDVFAIPDETADIGGDRLQSYRQSIPTAAANAGYSYISDFTDPGDLIIRIRALLTANPTKCLRRLEILAHSSPNAADGLDGLSISGFVAKFKKLRLCDRVEVWLTGCNTGLDPTYAPQGKPKLPVPKRMVDLMPFDATTFPHRVTVYGTVGYTIGTHLQNDVSTKRTLPASGSRQAYSAWPGAQEKTGNDSYKAFKNW